jgi:hypothetical protein
MLSAQFSPIGEDNAHMSSTPLPLFETRRAAYARVSPTKQKTYDRILQFARDRGSWGFTADELVVAWGCDPNHSSPRVTELVKSGKLLATKRRRPTRTGSSACVLVLADLSPERPLADGR